MNEGASYAKRKLENYQCLGEVSVGILISLFATKLKKVNSDTFSFVNFGSGKLSMRLEGL